MIYLNLKCTQLLKKKNSKLICSFTIQLKIYPPIEIIDCNFFDDSLKY